MVKNKLASLLLACALVLTPVFTCPVYADEAEDARAELEDLQSRMADMKVRQEEARKEAEAASTELNKVMMALKDINEESRALEHDVDALQIKITENQERLADQVERMKERKVIYKRRLRDIYIHGQVSYIDVLLGAKDFNDFSTRMYLLQKLIASDMNMIREIDAISKKIKEYQQVLNRQMQELKADQDSLEDKKEETQRLRAERQEILEQANQEKQQADEEYERLVEESERVTVLLRRLEESGGVTEQESVGGTGRFVWPVHGEITSYYGWRIHPIFGDERYHSGMDISADYDEPVVAADNGKVIYADWLGGYGECVMIDHGGGLVTLYGHNNELNVQEGQMVQQGQVIAYAGDTGYATGPHCHFEARLHGELTDPMDYLP